MISAEKVLLNEAATNDTHEALNYSMEGVVDGVSTKTKKNEHITKLDAKEESGNQLIVLNLLEFDNLVHQKDNKNSGAYILSDTITMSKRSGENCFCTNVISETSAESAASGVKEVGWSTFLADSTENSGHCFGSYSVCFLKMGGDIDAFRSLVGESLTNKPNVAIKNDEDDGVVTEVGLLDSNTGEITLQKDNKRDRLSDENHEEDNLDIQVISSTGLKDKSKTTIEKKSKGAESLWEAYLRKRDEKGKESKKRSMGSSDDNGSGDTDKEFKEQTYEFFIEGPSVTGSENDRVKNKKKRGSDEEMNQGAETRRMEFKSLVADENTADTESTLASYAIGLIVDKSRRVILTNRHVLKPELFAHIIPYKTKNNLLLLTVVLIEPRLIW